MHQARRNRPWAELRRKNIKASSDIASQLLHDQENSERLNGVVKEHLFNIFQITKPSISRDSTTGRKTGLCNLPEVGNQLGFFFFSTREWSLSVWTALAVCVILGFWPLFSRLWGSVLVPPTDQHVVLHTRSFPHKTTTQPLDRNYCVLLTREKTNYYSLQEKNN